MSFSKSKSKYDQKYNGVSQLERSLCTVDGKFQDKISIVDSKGNPNEEYFKWQFIFSLIDSNLVSRDYIGTEIYFPKGNIGSTPIKIDAVVFSQTDWLDYYKNIEKRKTKMRLIG